MRQALSLFVLILLGSLIAEASAQTRPHGQGHHGQGHQGQGQGPQFPTYNQPGSQMGQIISERVMQPLRAFERRQISELLRLSMSESRELEAQSISILASSLRGRATVEITSRGRQISVPQIINRQLGEVRFILAGSERLEDLEISASDEIQLDTITAEVRSSYNPYPGPGPGPGREVQPMSGQMLKLELREDIRYSGEIRLKQLVKQQLGITLEGAQIERIAVQGTVMRGRVATVQVEMNNRLVGPVKTISDAQGVTPIPLNSFEEVRGSLRLVVRGDVMIHQVNIRVGQVRPIQTQPQGPERIRVGQEISSGRGLELGRLLPYENRLVSHIVLEARASRGTQAEVGLIVQGGIVASTIVSQMGGRQILQLNRPVSLRELRLESFSPVLIESLEIGFGRY